MRPNFPNSTPKNVGLQGTLFWGREGVDNHSFIHLRCMSTETCIWLLIFLNSSLLDCWQKEEEVASFHQFCLAKFLKANVQITMITSKKMIKKVPEIKIIGNLPPPFLSWNHLFHHWHSPWTNLQWFETYCYNWLLLLQPPILPLGTGRINHPAE